jgi:hypothetical protein
MLAVARRQNDGGVAIKPIPAAGILIEIKKTACERAAHSALMKTPAKRAGVSGK